MIRVKQEKKSKDFFSCFYSELSGDQSLTILFNRYEFSLFALYGLLWIDYDDI